MSYEDEHGFPRDVWIDTETGHWGLASKLVLIHQTELPVEIGNKKLSKRIRRALVRCAGIDLGQPLSMAERLRNVGGKQ